MTIFKNFHNISFQLPRLSVGCCRFLLIISTFLLIFGKIKKSFEHRLTVFKGRYHRVTTFVQKQICFPLPDILRLKRIADAPLTRSQSSPLTYQQCFLRGHFPKHPLLLLTHQKLSEKFNFVLSSSSKMISCIAS